MTFLDKRDPLDPAQFVLPSGRLASLLAVGVVRKKTDRDLYVSIDLYEVTSLSLRIGTGRSIHSVRPGSLISPTNLFFLARDNKTIRFSACWSIQVAFS